MRRLAGLILCTGLVVAVMAAAALASTSARDGASSPAASVAAAKLPALPSYVKSRNRWVIGVKCDFPPFGYIDYTGANRGYEVAIARRFATLAFGRPNRIRMVCVTTPSRIPTLMSSQVDIIISTLTWTAARAQQINFSNPHYSATGRLLVPNDSPINSLRDLAGKTIVTTRGSIYATWTRNCFKNSTLLEVDGTAAAVLAVKEGRAATFMFDDAFVIGVATQDPTLKLTNDKFLNIPWGIGIRKDDVVMTRWVNAALAYMKARDEFATNLRSNVAKRYWTSFLTNVPRKGKANFQYPVGKDLPSDCSGIS
jgi:polar amino acid transport system substrate-binding protein